MTIDAVKISIKNHILNSISTRDLYTLCEIFKIESTVRRKQIQRSLLDQIISSTDLTLLHHILYMLNKSSSGNIVNTINNTNQQRRIENFNPLINRHNPCIMPSNANNFALNLRLYCLSNELIEKSPVDIHSELVAGVNPQAIFVPNFTRFPNGYFNAPSCAPTLTNQGRMNLPHTQLPYTSKNTTIKASPFYCCQVVIHPLSLLIPKPTPNIAQPNRIMSKSLLSFTLSKSVRQLITAHRSQVNNKRIYKWQILMRFGVYDPIKPFPSNNNDITDLNEYIPPYLSILVNNIPVPLWDILPSNNVAKEGKRHSRPINISDYLKYNLEDELGYRQHINVHWWQTPSVYLYYYAAIFLERKLDVKELLNQFIQKTHSVQRHITFTLDFIRQKFSADSKLNKMVDDDGNDDDLIMSSVLPISLQCPVGRSRITCPLRSINCQHLQCFDAHLYLMMNERRSIWKCPVCDCNATVNELFVDEYFAQILKDFEGDVDIVDVNVNPDGSYISVAVKESHENKQHIVNIIPHVVVIPEYNMVTNHSKETQMNSNENNPVILSESEDDEIVVKADNSPITNVNYPAITPECIPAITPLTTAANELTIDLTSDDDDDMQISMPTGATPTMSSNISSNVHEFPKLVDNMDNPFKLIIPDSINFVPNVLNCPSFPLQTNFNKIHKNSQLTLQRSKNSHIAPNISWIENQNLIDRYRKEALNTFNSQPVIAQHQLSLINNRMVQLIRKSSSIISTNSIKNMAKLPVTNNHTSNESLPQSSTSPVHAQKIKKQVPIRLPLESRGSRRSTRIETLSKKKYIESSSGDDDNDESYISYVGNFPRQKRVNPFDDSGSSSSEVSIKKRRRLTNYKRSPEEDLICNDGKPVENEDITNLKYPIICLTKLHPDVIKHYFKQNEAEDDQEPCPKSGLTINPTSF